MLNKNSSSKQTYKIDSVREKKTPKVYEHFLDETKSDPCGFAQALSMLVNFLVNLFTRSVHAKSRTELFKKKGEKNMRRQINRKMLLAIANTHARKGEIRNERGGRVLGQKRSAH